MSTLTEMQVEREELNPCTLLLSIKCTPDQVEAGFAKAYKRASKRVKVPGFRPGTAPRAMVKQYANPEFVIDVAGEAIVTEAYKQAIKDQSIEPHSGPRVELLKLNEDTGECEFKVKIPLAPQIELGEYKGLSIKKPEVEVTESEIEDQVEELRAGRAKRKAVENRGAQNGDFAVVNILSDEEGGEGRNFMTMVGHTFPQLDQALQGLRLDDIKHVDLTFPDEFQEKDWAGKTLSCVVRLKSLTAPEMPDLTDEFAKEFAADSVDELKEKIRTGLTNAKNQMVENYLHEQALTQVLENSTIHVPDPMWEDVASQRMQDILRDAAEKQVTLQQVAEANDMTIEQLHSRIRDEAKQEVQRALILTEVFRAEGMKVSTDELTREVEVIAREMGLPPGEALKSLRRSKRMDEIQFRALRRKVLSFLTENANVQGVRNP